MSKKLKRSLLLLLYLFHWRTLIWYVQWPYYEIRYWIKHRSRDIDEDSLQDEPKEWFRIFEKLRIIWKDSTLNTFSVLSSKFCKVHCRILINQNWVNFEGIKIDCSIWLNPDGELKRLKKSFKGIESHPQIQHDEKQFKDGHFTDHPDCRFFILDLESGEGFPGKTYWNQRNSDIA